MTDFNQLHDNIVSCAARILEQLAPEQVETFREAMGRLDSNEAMEAIDAIQTHPQFDTWRNICIALIDFQLQMHRVQTNLLLLNMPPPKEISLGEWTVYHQDAWWIWMQGLIERFDKLVKKIVRSLKNTDMNLDLVETEIKHVIEELKSKLRETRGFITHGGGAIEAFTEHHGIERYVLLGGNMDMIGVYKPMAIYKNRWYQILTSCTNIILHEIDKLSNRLNSEVSWDIIRP